MPTLAQLEPKTFLDSVLVMFTESASSRSLALSADVEEGLPGVFYSDKTKLTQILKTLSGQAICRTSKGSVAIHLKKVDCPSQGKQFIQFCVEDTGSGLDLDRIECILDTDIPVSSWPRDFSDRDSAVALRMAAKLVDILGGKLQVECGKAASMTRFFFTIPVAVDTSRPVPQPAPDQQPSAVPAFIKESVSSASQTAGIRVLIVDDVPENRMLVELVLKKMGHQTQYASNGQEAVDWCKKEKYDVILMDIQMPVLNGLEATRQIRDQGLNTQSTIIAMTASGEKSDDFAALDAGCDDCLSKPLDTVRLQRKLSRVAAQQNQLKDAEQGRAIVSFLEGDGDYQKAIETFIDTLPARVAEIKQAYQKGDTKDLAFKVHALKGVGGLAGFPVFTEKAKMMERSIKTSELDKLQVQIDDLAALCLRTKRKDQAQL